MGIPWREGKLGVDWDLNSPWWEFLGYDPYLSLKEYKFLKKYNLKKIPESVWMEGNYYECCDNCSKTSIRKSTGCPWCYARGIIPVGTDEVCDLHVKKYWTNAVLEHYCYRYWSEWLLRELKGIDKNFEYFKTIN